VVGGGQDADDLTDSDTEVYFDDDEHDTNRNYTYSISSDSDDYTEKREIVIERVE